MKHKITVIILAVMLVLSMLPISALASDTLVSGYDDNDVAKLRAFLELPNGATINGGIAYNPNFPVNWNGVIWDESTPKRFQRIEWKNDGMIGDLDLLRMHLTGTYHSHH